MAILRSMFVVGFLVSVASGQTPDATRPAGSAAVTGVVHDSIARAPLAEASVQLVGADKSSSFARTAVSDSLGRFQFPDVPNGRYTIGFFHPVLDSLGVEAPLREVNVDGSRSVRIDLAVPSATRLNAAICGARAVRDSAALILGVVRSAQDGAPVSGATVNAEWLEFSLRSTGLMRSIGRANAKSAETGAFAVCDVPNAGTVAILATRGADSTDRVEVQIPPERFIRRDLYIGSTQIVEVPVEKRPTDTVALPPRRIRTGNARLTGSVIATAGGRPVAGAQVAIVDGPQTRTNERGEWTLVNAPAGTRMLEVRAVGFYPDRRRVDVITGAEPVRVSLSTLKAVLDTVRIVASRLSRGPDLGGFQQRQRTGMGRFITPADIARFPAVVTSDLFRRVPGVRVEGNDITMRGAFEPRCAPAIFIDGQYMHFLTPEDINDIVFPHEVAGIEIYTEGTAPPQFQPGLHGCGSIVIWRK